MLLLHPDHIRLTPLVFGLQLLPAVLVALFAMPSLAWAETSLDDGPAMVRNIVIRRMNIFDEATTSKYIAPRLINRFHLTTRESVIDREIWFTNGDLVSKDDICLLYTSPSPRDRQKSRMPSSA